MHTETVFWSEMRAKKIMRLDKGESQAVEVISSGLDVVEGLVYDWIGENLYWLDSHLMRIEVAKANGENRMVLISEKVSKPRGIALDPTKE